MNFLAHAYLSFEEPDLLLGNMISDFVRGKKKFDYPLTIQKGISLHRSIDTFTDCHPLTKEARKFFSEDYGLYSGAFVDIVFDHFLARELPALEEFAQRTYVQLESNIDHHPENFRDVFVSMKKYNWLYNYSQEYGIERSFSGLVYRAKYMHDSTRAFNLFLNHYDELGKIYSSFFPELYDHSRKLVNIPFI